MNPAGYFPILKSENGSPIVGPSVIMEYLEDLTKKTLFNKKFNSEIRRLVFWFENIFKQDIIFPIINEKYIKDLTKIKIQIAMF